MTDHNDIKDLSFEDALSELESIVSKLERGDAPLEESIDIYERGARLKKHCAGKLKAAQLKVDKIVLGDGGELRTEPLDGED
ncbi:MAG: exodeoxyribonuclease VII small subunit [Robiginitomaculum sp.]|nr:MAG: exodeoxyribonuclease VII small subunit [Robiginitomaculum sp.]